MRVWTLATPEPSHQPLDVQDVPQWDARQIFGGRLIEGLAEPLLRQAGYLAGMKQDFLGLVDELG
jgi:hypothetical protein